MTTSSVFGLPSSFDLPDLGQFGPLGLAFPDSGAGGPTTGLGHSIAIDAGDLVIDERTGGPAVIEGRDALAQALVLAIETQRGSDSLNAGFGFDRLAVGRYALGVHARKEYIRMELVRCLGADRRVNDVREVFFDDDPRFLELQPDLDSAAHARMAAATRAARTYTVVAVVETTDGDTLTLQSGGRLE